MINSNISQDYLKFSTEKILLLKSAILSGEELVNSWNFYLSNFNFEKTDPVCIKLFPLLYSNLRKNKIEPPLLEGFRKIYNITWYKNKLLFNKMLLAIEALADSGIESIPLKGMALTLAFYKDFGLRLMNDFDLLVPEDKIMKSVEVLLNLGYNPENNFKFHEKYIQINNSYTFFGKDRLEFDLHWHILFESCNSQTDEILLQNLIPANTNGKKINVLNIENQLLQMIVHGLNCFSSSGFQWVADIVFLLQNFGEEINWKKLITNAERLNLSLSLNTGFIFINSEIKHLIPEWVIDELNSIKISANEKKELRIKVKGQGRRGHVHLLWYHYLRNKELQNFPVFPHYFLIFLQHKWSVKKIWLVPFYSIYLGITRLFNLSSD
jgi:Uncharacterised nucleotidyltransferase